MSITQEEYLYAVLRSLQIIRNHTRTLALVDCSGFLWCLLPMPNLILSYSASTQDPETELRQAFGTIVYRCTGGHAIIVFENREQLQAVLVKLCAQ